MYRESSMRYKGFPIVSYLSGVQFSVTNFFLFSHRRALNNIYLCLKKESEKKTRFFLFWLHQKETLGLLNQRQKEYYFQIESNGAIIVFFNYSEGKGGNLII